MFLEEEKIYQYRCQKIKKIKKIIDDICLDVAYHKNSVIVANSINEMALDLIYDGAAPKSHLINLRTEREGILGGYILANSDLSVLSKPISMVVNGEIFMFLKENSSLSIYKGISKNAPLVKAVINIKDQFITSDFDIVMICGQGSLNCEPVGYHFGMGDIAVYEYELSSYINKLFTKRLRDLNPQLSSSTIPFIHHGPFNRYSKSQLDDICFPLTIYHPAEGKILVDIGGRERCEAIKDFLLLCETFRSQGYNVELNKNWLWHC